MNLLSKVALKLTHVVIHLKLKSLIPSLALVCKKVVLPHVVLITLDLARKKLSANRELGKFFMSKAKVVTLALIPILSEFLEFTLKNRATTR